MTPREGEICTLCGYPVPAKGADLCDQCAEWQGIARAAEVAIAENQRLAEQRPEL